MPTKNSPGPARGIFRGGKTRLPLAVGVTAAVVAVVGVIAANLLGAASGSFSYSDEGAAPSVSEAPSADADAAEATPSVVVHVSGAVAEPGVYELPEGARVADAVSAAGGATDAAAPDALNLARELVDGEQVIVPTVEEAEQQASAASAAGDAAAGAGAAAGLKVNINTATAEQLDELPGVGPSTAQKIIADREANGPFEKPEDLKRVSGIGDKKYEQLADLISVG